MVVARTWWLIFSPAHRACASIDGSYRIHGELVFHIELFLRFIRHAHRRCEAGFGRPQQAAKREVVAGSTLLRTENRAGGSMASWLIVQE
jgi:hypothetical protein